MTETRKGKGVFPERFETEGTRNGSERIFGANPNDNGKKEGTVRKHHVLLLVAGFLAGIALTPFHAALAGLGAHDRSGVSGSVGQLEGACAECHNVSATAATRGWGSGLTTTTTGWYAQPITKLCYTCHASGGPGHDVTTTAMNSANHFNRGDHAPPTPNAADNNAYDNAVMTTSGLPYVTTGTLACTSCHNVHQDTLRPFLNRAHYGANSICDDCHPGRRSSTVGASNTQGTPAYSTHPVEITLDNGATTAASTILTTIDNVLATTIPGDNTWALGGHIFDTATGNPVARGTSGARMDCSTCHAVHGAFGGTSGIEDLVAIDQQPAANTAVASFLCEGCHNSVRLGGQVGAAGTDHPLDGYKGRTTFYPWGVALPSAWTAASVVSGASVFYDNAGVLSPRCSSCHDAHGGKPTKSILRHNVVTAGDGQPTGGEWCWSCHSVSHVVPTLHHSNTSTDNATFTSSITCAGCHGAPGTPQEQWRAHNGFGDFVVAPDARGVDTGVTDANLNFYNTSANTGTFQNLCEYCHIVSNPTTFVAARNFTSVQFPASHGNRGGTATHLTSQYATSGTVAVI
jgi:hypothetical protein